MRRWLCRRREPRIEEVRTEAAIDLRDGQIEGLRDALAEARAEVERLKPLAAQGQKVPALEQHVAHLKTELARAWLIQWLPRMRKAPFTE